MPQHDPIPAAHTVLDNVTEPYPTKSAKREAAISEWRRAMERQTTSWYVWVGVAAAYILAMGASFLLSSTLAKVTAALIFTAIGWRILLRMRRHDHHVRALAKLTPVFDHSSLVGEIAILEASRDALAATLANPASSIETRLHTANQLLSAALPIMRRGNVTIETATVSGYPPYPEIDQTELPGSNGDYLSIHLMRIDASVTRIARAAANDVILAESIGQLAGEVVPPLRALELALPKTR